VLGDLAPVLSLMGRDEEAREALRASIDGFAQLGDEVHRAGGLVNLAALSLPEEADRLRTEALAVFDRLGHETGRVTLLLNLAKSAREAGDAKTARERYEQAHLVAARNGNRRLDAMALHGIAIAQDEAVRAFADNPAPQPLAEEPRMRAFARGVTNLYREVLYLFLQRFVYRGQMVFFGTITNPVGCAVAYRRKYVERLFDHFGPTLGDDLTNSEDIFIGMGMLDEGYRNIQLTDVYARTVEPLCYRLPRQVYLWSSSFLQSCLSAQFREYQTHYQDVHDRNVLFEVRDFRQPGSPMLVKTWAGRLEIAKIGLQPVDVR
jgi:hypothetical protein